ncbi:MAG: GlsB/YeaQ/YmgE family stress response membrane protein, partial [Propionicimonas sp.]
RRGIDWASAFVFGLAGSFVGGLLISLLAGDGLALRPSGIIGSLAGASILTAAWQWWVRRAARTS